MDGFTVDPAALHAVSTRLRTTAADLDSVIATWAGATRDGAALFGLTESATAFAALHQDLAARLTTHRTSLDGLVTRVADTAGSYVTRDGLIASTYAEVAS